MGMKFKRMKHIRNRITLYYSLIVVLVVVTIIIFVGIIFSRVIIDETSGVLAQKMDIITRELDERLNSIRDITSEIKNNDSIQGFMRNVNKQTNITKEDKLQISNLLSVYSNKNNMIIDILALTPEKKILDPLFSSNPYNKIILENKNLNNFINSSFTSRFTAPIDLAIDVNGKRKITYFSRYLDKINYNELGYLIIDIKKETLFFDVNTLCKDLFDSAYIINSENQKIYQVGDIKYSNSFNNTSNDSSMVKKLIENKEYLIFNENLKNYPDWKIIGVLSYHKVAKRVWILNGIILGIGIFCIIIVIIVSYFIANRITIPILEVNNAMNKFQHGVWPEKLKTKNEDEIKELIYGFNNMIDNLKELVEKIYIEQEEKKKVEVKALKFQLELLQSQINPHFMHNTLNSIYYLAHECGAENIKEMIHAFNILLRASMSVGKEFITIEEEMTCILSYLKIQKYRYDDIFELVSVLSPDIKSYKIPRLILQPLVENSLYHGIAPKNIHGKIKIRFKKLNDKIKISVIDNGLGIEKDKIPIIMRGEKAKNDKGYNNIGLVNVDERLKLYFGNDYGIKILSHPGMGTCISFYLPYCD